MSRVVKPDLLAVRERKTKITRGAVHADEHGLLGELQADRARRVEPRSTVRQLELRGVREHDLHRAGGYESGAMRGLCPGASQPHCTEIRGQALA